ncbi:MAG: EF-hand domain-containing protein [Rhizobiales bacterium]|nr:EF-hand domain-containing protein [Hyphomicrobiales bacterium]OJY01479.1 MAG: acid-shock protein [Rhizobiales bacterium 63-22]
MIRPLITAMPLALVLIVAGPALAQTNAQTGTQTGTQAATPAPKRGVTLEQFKARREKAFMKADADHDGKISLAEWTAFRTKHNAKGDPSKFFKLIDTNHDGFIDHDELDAFLTKRFNHMDKNHDGVLTPDEMPGHNSATRKAQ